jgi:hypothetical protein
MRHINYSSDFSLVLLFRYIQVFVSWPVNRDCPAAFLKIDHEDCPFCAEHAAARMVVNFLKWVHTRASEM